MFTRKAGLLALLIMVIFSLTSAKKSATVKLKDLEPITLNGYSRLELLSYETGLKSYREYSPTVKGAELTTLSANLYTDKPGEMIGKDIAGLEMVFLDEKTGTIEICRPSMLYAGAKLQTSNFEIQRWSTKTAGQKITLIYAHNNDAIPVSLRHESNKECRLNTDESILAKVEAISAKSARIDDYIKAAYDGDLEKVKQAVEMEAIEVDAHPKNGFTALYAASANGKLEVVEYLYKKGADPYAEFSNIRMITTTSPLLIAIKNRHHDVVEYLVENGVDINKEFGPGWTALLYAAQINDVELVKYLIEKGSNIDAKLSFVNTKNTSDILDIATSSKAQDVIKYLEEIGYKSK